MSDIKKTQSLNFIQNQPTVANKAEKKFSKNLVKIYQNVISKKQNFLTSSLKISSKISPLAKNLKKFSKQVQNFVKTLPIFQTEKKAFLPEIKGLYIGLTSELSSILDSLNFRHKEIQKQLHKIPKRRTRQMKKKALLLEDQALHICSLKTGIQRGMIKISQLDNSQQIQKVNTLIKGMKESSKIQKTINSLNKQIQKKLNSSNNEDVLLNLSNELKEIENQTFLFERKVVDHFEKEKDINFSEAKKIEYRLEAIENFILPAIDSSSINPFLIDREYLKEFILDDFANTLIKYQTEESDSEQTRKNKDDFKKMFKDLFHQLTKGEITLISFREKVDAIKKH